MKPGKISKYAAILELSPNLDFVLNLSGDLWGSGEGAKFLKALSVSNKLDWVVLERENLDIKCL